MSRFRVSIIWELIIGFLMSVIGGVIVGLAESEVVLLIGACLAVAGLVVFVIGSLHLAGAKSYEGGWRAVGLLGALGILGLVAILLLPDREAPAPVGPSRSLAHPSGVSTAVSLDRCPACGSLVPHGEPCPRCEARQAQPRSNVWDLRIIGAVIVAVIALGVNVGVGLTVLGPVIADLRPASAAAEDAHAKSLVRNAMTAMESAFVDERTFYVPPQVLRNIEPSIDFWETSFPLVTVNGDLLSSAARASASQVEYYGWDLSYTIATRSKTGMTWGVFVDKSPDGGNWYLRSKGGHTEAAW